MKWNQRCPRGRWKRRGDGGGGHLFGLAGARHNPCSLSATETGCVRIQKM